MIVPEIQALFPSLQNITLPARSMKTWIKNRINVIQLLSDRYDTFKNSKMIQISRRKMFGSWQPLHRSSPHTKLLWPTQWVELRTINETIPRILLHCLSKYSIAFLNSFIQFRRRRQTCVCVNCIDCGYIMYPS